MIWWRRSMRSPLGCRGIGRANVTLDLPATDLAVPGAGLTGARVLLMGTGVHLAGSGLPDVPATGPTLMDLAQLLTTRCGVPSQSIDLVLDPRTPLEIGDAIEESVAHDAEVLLIYYVGHGLVSDKGLLYLATQVTTRGHGLAQRALPYTTLRDYVLNSTARTRIVVLDCCFSGKALGGMSDGLDEIANLTQIAGSVVLTSAGRDEVALAPPGARYTAFSGAFIRCLQEGDPLAGPRLRVLDAYRYLTRELPAHGFPAPRWRTDGNAAELPIAVNPAYRRPAAAEDVGDVVPSVLDAGFCPYMGLAAYDITDAALFFGRERLTSTLVGRLAERFDDPRPLVVLGASGSGKSSVLRAGLLTAVRRGDLALPGSAAWPQVVISPGTRPMRTLAVAVADRTVAVDDALIDRLRRSPNTVVDLRRRDKGNRLILLVDQFEELFTQCDDEGERHAFVQALCASASPTVGEPIALVVLGIRSDFYAQCAEFPELTSALQDPQLVGPMSEDELRAAIERPAAGVGVHVEPGLVELLLRDMGADAARSGPSVDTYEVGRLPLLSHALRTTWREGHGRLTVESYRRAGGISGALAGTADRALDRLDPAARATARRLLLRLVRLGDGTEDTRRRVPRSRLIAETGDPEHAAAIVAAFSADDTRLLTVDDDGVELTHEALLRGWPTFRTWVEADRAGLLVAQQLEEAAGAWHQEGRDPTALYRGSRLTLAQDWANVSDHRASLGSTASDFLHASEAADQADRRARRRRRRAGQAAVTALVIFLALAVAGGAIALVQYHHARTQTQAAAARELAATAQLLIPNQLDKAELLAVAAYRMHPDTATAQALFRVASASPALVRFATLPAAVTAIRPTADGNAVIAGTKDGHVLRWHVGTNQLDKVGQLSGAITSVTASRDGTAVAASDGTHVVAWSAGFHAQTIPTSAPVIAAVTLSPSGRLVAVSSGASKFNYGSLTVVDLSSHRVMGRTVDDGGNYVAVPDDTQLITFEGSTGYWARRRLPDLSLIAHSKTNLFGVHDYAAALSTSGDFFTYTNSAEQIPIWTTSGTSNPDQPPLWGRGPGRLPQALAVSSDGTRLAVADSGAIYLSNTVHAGQAQSMFEMDGQSTVNADGLAFLDNNRLVSADGAQLAYWDIKQASRIATVQPATVPTSCVGCQPAWVEPSPDGRYLAYETDGDGSVFVDDLTQQRSAQTRLTDNDHGYGPPVWSADGRHLLLARTDVGDVDVRSTDGNLQPPRWPPSPTLGQVAATRLTADGTRLVQVSSTGAVVIRDVQTGRPLQTIPTPLKANGGNLYAGSVAIRSDGRAIAYLVWTGDPQTSTVKYLDTVTRQSRVLVPSQPFGTVRFAGPYLLVASFDGTVELRDSNTTALIRTLPIGGNILSGPAADDAGDKMAVQRADGTVVISQLPTGTTIGTFQLPAQIEGLRTGMAFSHDGNTLYTVTEGRTEDLGQIEQWQLVPEKWAAAACRSAGRELTATEWRSVTTFAPPHDLRCR
jgi:WD40 repeat protein